MGSITAGQKAALEKQWANNEARLKLSGADKTSWRSLSHTIRPFVYYDKTLIIWSLVKGQPNVKDILAVTNVDGSFNEGLWVHIKSKVTGLTTIIDSTPRRLMPGLEVFAWMPFFNEVRYTGADWNDPAASRNLRLAVCFKMAADPHAPRLHEGLHYLSELHVFRETFPQYADTRF
jgi:hypothetical protein